MDFVVKELSYPSFPTAEKLGNDSLEEMLVLRTQSRVWIRNLRQIRTRQSCKFACAQTNLTLICELFYFGWLTS